jgi:hypothetical protein
MRWAGAYVYQVRLTVSYEAIARFRQRKRRPHTRAPAAHAIMLIQQSLSLPAVNNPPDSQWFEMLDIRRRRLANAVWIPLRQSEALSNHGEQGKVGECEEFLGVGSVAFHVEHRNIGESLGWSDIGIGHEAMPYAFKDGRYKPADIYLHNETDAVGVELIFERRLNGDHPPRWLVNQDLTMALGLIEEGDVWRCANEGYAEVIRSRREKDGRIVAIEIKAEFLRDYLAARGLMLRVAQYRQRMAILEDASYLPWAKEPKLESKEHDRFEMRVFEVDTSGALFGGSVAVFQVWRTDVDNEEDVPVFGPENDSNTASRSGSFERTGDKAYRAESELWREEWIEPADRSVRVRGDPPFEEFFYSVGAGGEQLPASALDNEEVGRYLWFRPSVIEALLQYRGARVDWYTRHTGQVKCSPDYSVHFGVNRQGFVNVYAYDVARLPQWQQRIWSGHNATPEGPVASELLDSQQRCEPAATTAPEDEFKKLLQNLNDVFAQQYGGPLFRPHESTRDILDRVHRFRALDATGLLALAKDVARITADSIDVGVLRTVVSPAKGETWRSLKHLENALATRVDADAAHNALTRLVGIYELRLADAHLPSSKLRNAYDLAGVNLADSAIDQAVSLIEGAMESLNRILAIMER